MEAVIIRDGHKDKLMIFDDGYQLEKELGLKKHIIIQRVRRFDAVVNRSTEKLI